MIKSCNFNKIESEPCICCYCLEKTCEDVNCNKCKIRNKAFENPCCSCNGLIAPSKDNEELPYGIKKEQICTYAEFEKYKIDKETIIEDVLENTDYHGYKFYTILFKDGTADEVFIKMITQYPIK